MLILSFGQTISTSLSQVRGGGESTRERVAQICIVGDGAVAVAVADLISRRQAPDGASLEARIICDDIARFAADFAQQSGREGAVPELQGYLHSAVGKVKGLRHSLRQARSKEQSQEADRSSVSVSAFSLMSGLEAAATGLMHVDAGEVLSRPEVSVDSLSSFERAAEFEVVQAFIFACQATRYGEYLERLAPSINDGCSIVLLSAPPFASLEVKHRLAALRPGVQVDVIEVDEIFNCLEERNGHVLMIDPARRVNVAGPSLNETRRTMWLPAMLCRDVIPASGLIERALLDAHSILRPGFLLAALLGGRLDGALSDISRLLNRANLSMFVEIEQELSRVAAVSHCQPVDLARSLREEVDVRSSSQGPVCDVTLAEAIVTIAGKWFSAPARAWSYTQAQESLCFYASSYLLPLSQLGDSLGIPTPVIDSVISMASAITGQDLRACGRSFAVIGIDGKNGQELLEFLAQ